MFEKSPIFPRNELGNVKPLVLIGFALAREVDK